MIHTLQVSSDGFKKRRRHVDLTAAKIFVREYFGHQMEVWRESRYATSYDGVTTLWCDEVPVWELFQGWSELPTVRALNELEDRLQKAKMSAAYWRRNLKKKNLTEEERASRQESLRIADLAVQEACRELDDSLKSEA